MSSKNRNKAKSTAPTTPAETPAVTAGAPNVSTVDDASAPPVDPTPVVTDEGAPVDADATETGTEQGTEEAGVAPPSAPPETVRVISKEAYIRSTPEKLKDRSNTAGTVKAGKVLTVVERLDEWVKIGEDRYIYAECVK
jgi:hypothetical protein